MRLLLRPSHARAITGSCTPRCLARKFHASATRQSPFTVPIVADALNLSYDVLYGAHYLTGLPWGVSIPLTAVMVRLLVATPLQISARRHARRRADLNPLLMSYKTRIDRLRKEEALVEKTLMVSSEKEQLHQKYLKDKRKHLFRRWNISNYAMFYPFLQIPVWLSFMEAVRALCGANAGLFRYFLPVATGDGGDAIVPGVQPTLANEGFLWFSDLLAGDPTGALPLFLGLSIVLNVQTGWKTKTLAEASDYSDRKMLILLASKISKGLCSSFGAYIAFTAYVTSMPAGMMLYWIASTNVATLQSLFLEKFMFARKPLQPWAEKHVRVLKSGEKPPPKKSLLP